MTKRSVLTINDILISRAEETPDESGVYFKEGLNWKSITWAEYLKLVRSLAAGLIKLGVKKGDNVAIVSGVRYEWEVFEKACFLIGAVVIGIDKKLLITDIGEILKKCEVVCILIENEKDIDECISIPLREKVKIVTIDNSPYSYRNLNIVNWDALITDDQYQEKEKILPEDLVMMICTSGTSGTTKILKYNHHNLVVACCSLKKVLTGLGTEDSTICWLPLAYMTSRISNLFALYVGVKVYYCTDHHTIAADILKIKPVVFVGIPRFYEKIRNGILDKVNSQPFFIRGLTRAAFRMKEKGKKSILSSFFDHLIFRRIRAFFGGNMRIMITGSAPLSKDVTKFFYMIGIPLLDAYALSENAIPMTMNTLNKFKYGTVGLPLQGNEIKIDSNGEILVRSQGLSQGYHGRENAKEKIFDEEGFLKTGDYGNFDEDGYLVLAGRKQEIIKTSVGYSISVKEIEELLKQNQIIYDVVVIGNSRPFITLLVTVREQNKETFDKVKKWIDECNEKLASFKNVKKYTILANRFSDKTGEYTATLKLRRNFIINKYKNEIDKMYE